MPLYIKSPITGEQIQVAEEDFPDLMDWDDAMSACQNLGNGWRLPNKEELEAMYEQLHKQGKGNLNMSGTGAVRKAIWATPGTWTSTLAVAATWTATARATATKCVLFGLYLNHLSI